MTRDEFMHAMRALSPGDLLSYNSQIITITSGIIGFMSGSTTLSCTIPVIVMTLDSTDGAYVGLRVLSSVYDIAVLAYDSDLSLVKHPQDRFHADAEPARDAASDIHHTQTVEPLM